LGKYGYQRDDDLSNHNQQVYYNPIQHKILYDIAGTHNLSDVGTDLYLAAGHLKDTNRYKEADSTLQKAKSKYGVSEATVTGHSLGGSIAGYVANKQDKVITLDKGATIGQPIRSNEKAYRTSGDAVSLLNAGSRGMTTLPNPNKSIRTGNAILDIAGNILNAHNVSNIKNSSIFV
jgi:fermentation-respiration switch protein FrsA (DUF1100 family)